MFSSLRTRACAAFFAACAVSATLIPGAQAARAGGTAADVVAAVNAQRAEAGCHPVHLRPALNRAAKGHSADMAGNGRLQHAGSDGSSPMKRMRAAGYRSVYAGEAIADGVGSARAVVRLWMNSPSHRELILTCRFTHAGVGRAGGSGGPWWTLDLASKR